MQRKAYILSLILLTSMVVMPVASVAQNDDAYTTKYAQAGMPFLTIDVDSRIAAMGGTQVGAPGDPAAMFANPAGLAMADGIQLLSSVTNWLTDIQLYGGGVTYSLGNAGTFGVNLVWMDYGEIRRTIPYQGLDPEQRAVGFIDQGNFSVGEYAVGVSYARQISTQFYVGGNFKYARQDLGDVDILDPLTGERTESNNVVSNLVLDFGTLYYPGFQDLRFGASIRNFSNQSDYFDQRFELPLTFDFGVAMNLFNLDPDGWGQSDNELILAIDAIHPRDFAERVHTGVEFNYQDLFFLRSGYKFNYDEQGYTGGLGVNVGMGGLGMKADYAYAGFGRFADVHRISLNLSFQ